MRDSHKYVLTAENIQGARTCFTGKTKKEALAKFDEKYVRKGFRITIEGETGYLDHTVIKKTYR